MEIMASIAALSQGITIAKALRSIEKTYDEAAYKVKITDVIEALVDAKIALSDAKENLAEKDKEIIRLKSNFETRSELVQARGDYKYIANDLGDPTGYPICPKCEIMDGRIIQLKQDGGQIAGICPACSSRFNPVTAYYDPQEQDRRKAERAALVARSEEKRRHLGQGLA